MIPLSIRSQTTLFLCLTVLVALGEARIPKSKSVKKAFQLILTPIHTATSTFYIIFGVTTVFQALPAFFKAFAALRNIGRRAQVAAGGHDFTTSTIYVYLVFLGAPSALVYELLSTVWIVLTQNQFATRAVPNAFMAGKFFVSEGADFFICFALLALLYHRQRTAYRPKAEELRPYRYKLILDALLLVSYLAFIILYASLCSAYSSSSPQTIGIAYLQLLAVNRAVIGLFCALTINVTASSIWTSLVTGPPKEDAAFARILVEGLVPLSLNPCCIPYDRKSEITEITEASRFLLRK